jgi:hypothetical protein
MCPAPDPSWLPEIAGEFSRVTCEALLYALYLHILEEALIQSCATL